MKRVNNIYHKICDVDNIMMFEHIVSVNTSNKKKLKNFKNIMLKIFIKFEIY